MDEIMGEYAKRKKDGVTIKIGTLEMMYYLRRSQKNEVNYDFSSGIFYFRLPFPDEDGTPAGEYRKPFRNIPLRGFACPECAENKGIMQIKHEEAGILCNIPCYHGEKLPEGNDDIQFFFNGKADYFYEFVHIYEKGNDVKLVIRCRYCHKIWLADYEEVEDFIPKELKENILKEMLS